MVGNGVHRNWMGDKIAVMRNWWGHCGGLLLAEQACRLSPGMSVWTRLARSASAMSLLSAIRSRAVVAAAAASLALRALATQKSRRRASFVSVTGVNVGKYVAP